mmetsp:Transcript_27213/g.39878  ORF Transcript_27213/g.39878 Transcript_27213/m.39878 type:complete len:95 (-) Transcript_27213:337-621(-)
MKVDGNVHSSPDGTLPPETTAGSPPVDHNKMSAKKDGTKSDGPKPGNPKNGDGGKVGHSGSIAFVGIDDKTEREPDDPTSPKKGSRHPPAMTWR